MLPTTGMNHAGCTCTDWICASTIQVRTIDTVTTAMTETPVHHRPPEMAGEWSRSATEVTSIATGIAAVKALRTGWRRSPATALGNRASFTA